MGKMWSIEKLWNEQLSTPQTTAPPRNYIRASEIGSPFLDRYYRMKGVPPSNQFDIRTLRIFDAGKLWELIVVRILKMAGILQSRQDELIIPENKDHLLVKGHVDAIVGGKPDFDQAKASIHGIIQEFGLEEGEDFLEQRALKLVEYLSKEFPDGLEPVIAEVKSVNSMAFWAHKNLDAKGYFKGYDHHKLQLLTYLLGHPSIKIGKRFYISKDDMCLKEDNIKITEDLKKKWLADVTTMSNYYRNNQEPPKEDDIVWNPEKESFELNWKLKRSNYLTKITGLTEDQWIRKHYRIAKEKTLEYKWKTEGKRHGLDIEKMTIEEIKKECMKRNKLLKKIVIIREGEDDNEGEVYGMFG